MEIGAQTGHEPGAIIALLLIALLFGVTYAIIIHRLKKSDRLEGYTAFAVVAGVVVTLLIATPIIGIVNVLFTGAFFVSTGIPMILGNIYYYTEQRRQRSQELTQILKEATNEYTH